jgi:hypothetical protein
VFQNRLPRRIFGPEMDEIIGNWRCLCNEGLQNLHPSPKVIRMIKVRKDEIGRASTHGR